MTEEKYQELKEEYIGNIKQFMTDMGSIFPHISVFANHKDDEEKKDAIVHIQVPEEFMRSEQMKETFVQDVIPEIAKKIREKFIPYGVAWTSEAWVRTATKDEAVPNNWKDLPIDKEILMVSMEFVHKKEFIIFDIKRNGKQVNEDGDLVDHVDLLEQDFSGADGMSGRFTGLLEKFTVRS